VRDDARAGGWVRCGAAAIVGAAGKMEELLAAENFGPLERSDLVLRAIGTAMVVEVRRRVPAAERGAIISQLAARMQVALLVPDAVRDGQESAAGAAPKQEGRG